MKDQIKPFGALEAKIMEVLWLFECASVRQVLDKLKADRKVAYTTVMTVMDRLYKKGVLKRQKDTSGAYLYCPTQKKDLFLAKASKQAIQNLIKEYGNVAVAQFVDVLESSNLGNSKDLKAKLKKIR